MNPDAMPVFGGDGGGSVLSNVTCVARTGLGRAGGSLLFSTVTTGGVAHATNARGSQRSMPP
jgi:hypothetical protein